jgi:hypothetical protein
LAAIIIWVTDYTSVGGAPQQLTFFIGALPAAPVANTKRNAI